jgi:hypothetical protein
MGVEDFDQQLHDDVEDLVAEGLLDRDSAAYGIAQQMITDGPRSMSNAQEAVYESVVVPALRELHKIRESNR